MDPQNCAHCNMEPFPGCDGTGAVRCSERKRAMCQNLYIIQVRSHLGREISNAPLVRSPLLNPEAKVDRTTENLWFKVPWPAFLPHLKWVLGMKGLSYVFEVITDAKIRNVYVGDEAFRSRSVEDRADLQNFNTLEDLVGRKDLVILRVGHLGHKNIAAAGAIKEALMVREALNKPTWLVEDTRPEYSWRFSKSEELLMYLHHFKEVSFEQLNAGLPKLRMVPMAAEPEIDPSSEEVEKLLEGGSIAEPVPFRPRKAVRYDEPSFKVTESDDVDLPGSKRRRWK